MSGWLDHFGEYDGNGGCGDTTDACREGPFSLEEQFIDDENEELIPPALYLPRIRQVDDGNTGNRVVPTSRLYPPLPAASV